MKSANTRAMVALVIGAVLTLAAFIGTFFWAAVPDYGTVSQPKYSFSARHPEAIDERLAHDYIGNRVGYEVEVVTDEGTVTGTLVAAEPKEGSGDGADAVMLATVATASGEQTIEVTKDDEVTAQIYNYGKPDWGQKIFYFHVPIAEISFIVFAVAAYFSVRFIMTRKREYDTKSRIAMELTMTFVALTMATGILWTKAAWGVWWQWEPRLTTYFIMTLLVVAYFVLRNSVEDEERRALYAAAFSILAFIDAPISFFITRLIPSTHPVIESGGLQPPMLITFIIAQIGMLFVGYAIYRLRMGEMELRDRIERAKTELEG